MSGLNRWLAENNFGGIVTTASLGGGCINQVSRIVVSSGQKFCLKQNSRAPADFFAAEATNLRALSGSQCLQVPAVHYVDDRCLLLEYIHPADQRAKDFWQTLAHQLADCHNQTQEKFGFTINNYCGNTAQHNPQLVDGFEFFATQRLQKQSQWARDRRLLSKSHCQQIDQICRKLKNLIPPQSAALIHGDLWAGNLHHDEQGQPVLIDPASYWGWPEADLAMTQLFGGFAEDFYHCYQEVRALAAGWRERFGLYNLYHLLNHLNLFGRGYLPSVEAILDKYG